MNVYCQWYSIMNFTALRPYKLFIRLIFQNTMIFLFLRIISITIGLNSNCSRVDRIVSCKIELRLCNISCKLFMYQCFWVFHYCADRINMIPSHLICLLLFFKRFVKWYSQNLVISKGFAERAHVYSVHYRIKRILIVLKSWFIFTHYYNIFKLLLLKKLLFEVYM